ncbi:MAG TPA: hypothetical protein VG994_20785 [Steroidobacteraceae bacterium]|jgi:uncharacterized protein YjgD (DUF1641 family)|nr:hypothetical protein [Steroidobacteraceae bacterium]HVY83434.1 hypothetical protein [Steroidobacteraceae bacterium]
MAEAIRYTVPPPRIETTAREELDRLLETCHRHGVLRLMNDVVASNTQLAQVIVEGLQSEGAQNAIKNASILLMALSRMPPEQFYRVIFAMRDGVATLTGAAAEEPDGQEAPGITGALRMLHDEQLWRALSPLVAALKAFATRLDREVESPIADFSGKPGRPS